MNLIDKEIISYLKKSDKRGMELILDHYADTLFGVVSQIVTDEKLASEAFEESMIRIWKKSHQYNASKSTLFTWLLRITRKTALGKVRSKVRSHEFYAEVVHELRYDLHEQFEYQFKNDHLRKGLDHLKAKYQEVFDALFFKDMNYKSAATYLEIPISSVKDRLKLGVVELRKYLALTLFIILPIIQT